MRDGVSVSRGVSVYHEARPAWDFLLNGKDNQAGIRWRFHLLVDLQQSIRIRNVRAIRIRKARTTSCECRGTPQPQETGVKGEGEGRNGEGAADYTCSASSAAL